uniref:DUF4596 domain-containing protein n=1 Tax=Gongylonema pulchrum TaxID=637853 RepID=A0A183CWD0_9BILA
LHQPESAVSVTSIRPMPNDLKKAVKNLHMNWYIHAVKALFGQLGKQLYQQLAEGIRNILILTWERKTLASCLDKIVDERDLAAGARCLVKARYKITPQKFGKSSKPKDDYSPAFLLASNSMEDASSASKDSHLPIKSTKKARHHLINSYRLPTEISLPQNSTKSYPKISQSSKLRRNESNKSQRQFEYFEGNHLKMRPIKRLRTTRVSNSPNRIRWPKKLKVAKKNGASAKKSSSRLRASLAVLAYGPKKAGPKIEPGLIGPINELERTRSASKFKAMKARSTSYITGPTIASFFKGLQRRSKHRKSTISLTDILNGARWHAEKTKLNSTQEISRKNSDHKWNQNSAPVSLFTLTNSTNAGILMQLKVLGKVRNRSKRSPYRLISNQIMKSDNIIIDVSYFSVSSPKLINHLPFLCAFVVSCSVAVSENSYCREICGVCVCVCVGRGGRRGGRGREGVKFAAHFQLSNQESSEVRFWERGISINVIIAASALFSNAEMNKQVS